MKTKKSDPKKKIVGCAILRFQIEGFEKPQYGICTLTEITLYKHTYRGSANFEILDAGEWGPTDAAILERIKEFLEI